MEGEPGLGKETLDKGWRYWILLSRFLTPGPPGSGQATTIWIPHDPGIDPPPSAITQARRKRSTRQTPAIQSLYPLRWAP